MDALKQKYGNESPEDRKKRKKSLVLPNIGTLAICIAMLAVGIQYNDEEECKGKVTYLTEFCFDPITKVIFSAYNPVKICSKQLQNRLVPHSKKSAKLKPTYLGVAVRF